VVVAVAVEQEKFLVLEERQLLVTLEVLAHQVPVEVAVAVVRLLLEQLEQQVVMVVMELPHLFQAQA
jgi:hypothetical protein